MLSVPGFHHLHLHSLAPEAAMAFLWYMRQSDQPLVSRRGHVYDHIALSVTDLDAWVAKLRGEGVTFLAAPYQLGETRAVMIEGPSREALELVEVKDLDSPQHAAV